MSPFLDFEEDDRRDAGAYSKIVSRDLSRGWLDDLRVDLPHNRLGGDNSVFARQKDDPIDAVPQNSVTTAIERHLS